MDEDSALANGTGSTSTEDLANQDLAHPLLAGHGTLLYTTSRHTPERHRFRIIFALPRTITDPDEFRAITTSLALFFQG